MTTEIAPVEKTWCAKCAHFQPVASLVCEKCGAKLPASDEPKRRKSEARQRKWDQLEHGPESQSLICPHCQTRGKVRTRAVSLKAGISGGKATAAILTGGISLFAIGLSRKQQMTEAWCGGCKATWRF